MFVKRSWNPKMKKRYCQYHVAESYRDPQTGQTRHWAFTNPDGSLRVFDKVTANPYSGFGRP